MQLIVINYFSRSLNLDLPKTYFAKTLGFYVVAVYFAARRGVAQLGSASDILSQYQGLRSNLVIFGDTSVPRINTISICFGGVLPEMAILKYYGTTNKIIVSIIHGFIQTNIVYIF